MKQKPQIMHETEENASNVVDFLKVIEAKPSGKGPTEDNWLAGLEPDTVFLTRLRGSKHIKLEEYTVIFHTDKSTLLLMNIQEHDVYTWFDTQGFSSVFELFEITHNEE